MNILPSNPNEIAKLRAQFQSMLPEKEQPEAISQPLFIRSAYKAGEAEERQLPKSERTYWSCFCGKFNVVWMRLFYTSKGLLESIPKKLDSEKISFVDLSWFSNKTIIALREKKMIFDDKKLDAAIQSARQPITKIALASLKYTDAKPLRIEVPQIDVPLIQILQEPLSPPAKSKPSSSEKDLKLAIPIIETQIIKNKELAEKNSKDQAQRKELLTQAILAQYYVPCTRFRDYKTSPAKNNQLATIAQNFLANYEIADLLELSKLPRPMTAPDDEYEIYCQELRKEILQKNNLDSIRIEVVTKKIAVPSVSFSILTPEERWNKFVKEGMPEDATIDTIPTLNEARELLQHDLPHLQNVQLLAKRIDKLETGRNSIIYNLDLRSLLFLYETVLSHKCIQDISRAIAQKFQRLSSADKELFIQYLKANRDSVQTLDTLSEDYKIGTRYVNLYNSISAIPKANKSS